MVEEIEALLAASERARSKLYVMSRSRSVSEVAVIKLSIELDELVNSYHKLIQPCRHG